MVPVRMVAAPFPVSVAAIFLRFTWYLSLATLLYTTCVTSASIIAVRIGGDGPGDHSELLFARTSSSSLTGLAQRGPTEHVILCDCISASGIRSSQMAYYSGDVIGLPTAGVGIVDTEFNTTAAWYNETTSATWLDTGVTFKAVIWYHVAEGDYVGKGNNGYGDFRCWQRSEEGFSFDYKGDGTVCTMKIDCNKNPAPASNPPYVPLKSTTTTTTPTNDDQAAGSSATPSPSSSEDKKDKSISTGAVIGIAIGTVGAFTLLAGGAGFCIARRRRQHKRRRQQQQEEEAQGRKSTVTDSTINEAYAPGPGFLENDGGNPNTVYELDGGWYRHEMGDDPGHYEIDGQVRCEADAEDGEIKEKMDDLFAEADVKEMIVLGEKTDSKKIMLDDEKEKKGHAVVVVSEKEKEIRRDKEEQERERQQEQHKQKLEEQKRNRDSEEQLISPTSPVSPISVPLSPTTASFWTEKGGQTPFCVPALMPEPEKFMAEEFKAVQKEKLKDETNTKFRFEEEERHKYVKEEEIQKVSWESGKDTPVYRVE